MSGEDQELHGLARADMPSSCVHSVQQHDKMKRSPTSKAQPWHLRPAAARTKDGSRIPQKDKHELISSMIAPLMSNMNTASGGSMQWFVPIICLCGKVSPASGLVVF